MANFFLLLPVKIVGQINANEDPSGGGVNAHVISGVVKVFGACVSLDVMRVVVTPAKLNIDPVLLSCGAIHDVTTNEVKISLKYYTASNFSL